jgi:uncharacterized protein (DUF1330 family)
LAVIRATRAFTVASLAIAFPDEPSKLSGQVGSSNMPAYMIVTARIADRNAFLAGYGPAAAALVEKYGGRYLLRGPGAELLEGGFGEGASVVISEWPDKAAARRFWDSPDYAEAKKMREGIADCQVLLIEAPAIAASGEGA